MCNIPVLLPENETAWGLIGQITSGLISRQSTGKFSFWSMNCQTIFGLLGLYDFPDWEKRELLRKITVYGTILIKHEQDKHG